MTPLMKHGKDNGNSSHTLWCVEAILLCMLQLVQLYIYLSKTVTNETLSPHSSYPSSAVVDYWLAARRLAVDI